MLWGTRLDFKAGTVLWGKLMALFRPTPIVGQILPCCFAANSSLQRSGPQFLICKMGTLTVAFHAGAL